MPERPPSCHANFDALGPDSAYMTSDVKWPPQSSRHEVAEGTPWQGGTVTPAEIIAVEVFPFVGDRDGILSAVEGLIDGNLIAGSQKAAAVLALSAYLAARVGWSVVPGEPSPIGGAQKKVEEK